MTIQHHIRTIYEDGELDEDATSAKFAVVQNEGGREVTRQVTHYDLDVILGVGFRAKSPRASEFRKWAMSTLRAYLVDGYAINESRLRDDPLRSWRNGVTREEQMVVISRKPDGTPDVWCDPEIAPLVRALNHAGIRTVASCSGHGDRPGNIALADGRELIIAANFGEARRIEASMSNHDSAALADREVSQGLQRYVHDAVVVAVVGRSLEIDERRVSAGDCGDTARLSGDCLSVGRCGGLAS